jgi:hypothetical protein
MAIVLATACHVAPAEAYEWHGYECYPGQTMKTSKHMGVLLGGNTPITLKQCLAVCDKTPGCTAVHFDKFKHTGPYPYCVLYSLGKDLVTPSSYAKGSSIMVCIKLSPPAPPIPKGTYPKGDPKHTYQEIPPKIPHDQFRQQPMGPTPQPNQAPGRR